MIFFYFAKIFINLEAYLFIFFNSSKAINCIASNYLKRVELPNLQSTSLETYRTLKQISYFKN